MATHGHGFDILSASSSVLVSFVCHAFVDDADMIQSTPTTDAPGEEMIAEMQTALDCWGGVSPTTGGVLVPSKSHWCAIDFCSTGAKWAHRTVDEMPRDISITGADRTWVALQRHEATVWAKKHSA
jgi:hypothetical protein